MILMFSKRINKKGKIAEKGIRKYVLKKINNYVSMVCIHVNSYLKNFM